MWQIQIILYERKNRIYKPYINQIHIIGKGIEFKHQSESKKSKKLLTKAISNSIKFEAVEAAVSNEDLIKQGNMQISIDRANSAASKALVFGRRGTAIITYEIKEKGPA